MNETKLIKLMQSIETMQKCDCKRGEQVLFVCTKPSCPSFESLKLYCMKCYDDYPPRHVHMPIFIVSVGENFKCDWKQLRSKIKADYAFGKNWV